MALEHKKQKDPRQQSSVNANHQSMHINCIVVELVWSFFFAPNR